MSVDATRSVQEIRKDIEAVENTWWSITSIPGDSDQQVLLTFEDASAKFYGNSTQTWGPEPVPCSLGESFAHAFQRFRVQANKKHRHPFRPALSFLLISNENAGGGSQEPRIAFEDAHNYTVQQVVELFGGSTTLAYARDDSTQRPEHDNGQLRLNPWDRTLPPWCSTPAHWIAPSAPQSVLPPSRHEDSDLPAYVWRKVPTLHLPGLGTTILPSTVTPTLIASSLFLVAHPTPAGERCIDLDGTDADLVVPAEKLDPRALTPDAVRRLLLGRYVQTCAGEEGEGERPAKRARTARRAGVAWGYEPATRRLYCVTPANGEFMLDLSGSEDAGEDALGPAVVRCARLGPVSLAVAAPDDAPPRDEFAQYRAWFDAYEERVRRLNAADGVFVFEVRCAVARCAQR